MYKIIFLSIIYISSALADSNSSIWKLDSKAFDSLWKSTKELSGDAWEGTKKYTNMGKNILLSETFLNTMNLSLDTNTTEVKEFTINEDDSIDMKVKLVGEKRDLEVKIEHYDWGVSDNNEFIVFENIKYQANIEWIKYLIDFYLELNKGYINIPYSVSKEGLLLSLKSDIKSSFDTNSTYTKGFWDKFQKDTVNRWNRSDKRNLTNIFKDLFDKNYIEIKKLQIKDKKIYFSAFIKDSKDDIEFYIDSFNWATANKKSFILIKDITIKGCKKPWIESLIKKHDNSFYFTYSKFIEKILKSIKPPLKG